MTVVSDTTAITTLLKAEQERLLQDMFGCVSVPTSVWHELKEFHPQLARFIQLCPVRDSTKRLTGTEPLGRGEAEALLLARELNTELLLTDDSKARLAARRLQIRCIGLVGLVVQAKRLGRIPSVRDLLQIIATKGGLYLSDMVITEALRMAGEI
jgi:uncharacterized protein